MNETVVPEGRGKAEAARTFLATGGGLRSRGGTRQSGFRYTKGILKGKTKEEAQSMFEDRWAGASGAIKDKYAKRGSNAGVLAPSEMAEMKPQAGVEYGTRTISGVSKPGPADISKKPDSMQPGTSSVMQGPPSSAAPAPSNTPGNTPRQKADISEILNRGATNPVTMRGTNPPVAAPALKKPTINSLTGLPMGFRPGDKLPDGSDGVMQKRADESLARQTEASAKAKPYTSPTAEQTPSPSGYAGPKTRFTPGMGHVPVATPVTNGDEQISYGTYDAARTRMKTPGGTSGQDKQDATLMTEFNRQAMKRIGKADTAANRSRRLHN